MTNKQARQALRQALNDWNKARPEQREKALEKASDLAARARRGTPQSGKVYRLIGKPGEASIAHGNTWAESVVPDLDGCPKG